MIRHSILDTELAEPAIGEVHLHFTADQPLRADRKDIPHTQHPDHQFWIDRRATHGRIMRRKLAAKPGQIESSVDLPYQMILRNRGANTKLVGKLPLAPLQPAPHCLDLPKIRLKRTESRLPASLNRLLQQNRHKADRNR